MKLSSYKRELAAAVAYALLLILAGIAAPSFFSAGNLRDLAINNAPLLIIAIGMTMVILIGEIDISVGSQFAVYVVVVVVNYLAFILGVSSALAALGVEYHVARIVAGACEAVYMYSAMRWVVFRR